MVFVHVLSFSPACFEKKETKKNKHVISTKLISKFELLFSVL